MEDAVKRVKAYIGAYHEAWTELYERVQRDGDFDIWRDAMTAVGEAHCLDNANEIDAYSIGSPPSHDPEAEEVLDSWQESDITYVLTRCGDYRYFEYELQESGDEWWITHIMQTAADPREPLITSDELEAALARAKIDAPFQPLGKEGPSNSLFEAGRTIESTHETDTLTVRRIGELNVVSGVLVVQDFGYDAWGIAPLERKVPPGRYPVDVSSVFRRNAAMRVCFGDPNDVVSWHPANIPGSGHVAGVDAGNLAVFDLASFGELTLAQKERVYEGAVVSPSSDPAAQMITLVHPNDGAVASSGWGDGAYPVHWGVDAAGEPVVLLLDFLIACTWTDDGYKN